MARPRHFRAAVRMRDRLTAVGPETSNAADRCCIGCGSVHTRSTRRPSARSSLPTMLPKLSTSRSVWDTVTRGVLGPVGYHCRLECVCHVGYRAVWDSQAKISKLEAAAAALQLRHEEEMISLRDEHAVALSAARASATAEATRGAGALAVRVSTRSECSVGQGRWEQGARSAARMDAAGCWLLAGIRMTMDGRSRLL
jgi:hypothetical protein